MPDQLRQRRKSATVQPIKHDHIISETSRNQLTPIEQLRHAEARLINSRDRTADLHRAWRNQMFRISLIIICVTLHQLHASLYSCISDVKAWNQKIVESYHVTSEEKIISGLQTGRILFIQSFFEFLGFVTASLLAYFLTFGKKSSLEFSKWPYVVSSALVPIQLGIYFHSPQLVSCVGDELVEGTPSEESRIFPIVVIYHSFVTIAIWFMKSGMDQCEEHVKLVTDSIENFERLDRKLKSKKQILKKS